MSWFAPLPLVRELGPRESAEVLAKDFDIELPDDGFPKTEPVWELTQREVDSVLDTLSPRSSLRADSAPHPLHVVSMEEQRRIAADVWYANHKASGQLQRDQDHRALVEQVKHEVRS